MTTCELLRQWYDEVWNKGNDAFINTMMHKKVIIHGLDPKGRTEGVESFKTYYNEFRKTFPVTSVKTDSLVYDDHVATVYCHVSGKSIGGIEVAFTGLSVARFEGEKLVEAWNNFDFLKMYQQLGHILEARIED